MSLELRINDLESRLAFQDDTIQALNDVLVDQQRLLDRLQLQLAACGHIFGWCGGVGCHFQAEQRFWRERSG